MGDDLDIYGDLCADLPAPPPLPIPSPGPLALPAGSPAPSEESCGAAGPAADPGAPAPAAEAVWEGWVDSTAWSSDWSEGLVVEGGQVVEGTAGATAAGRGWGRGRAVADDPDKPQDFEELQKELLADEEVGGVGSPVSDAPGADAGEDDATMESEDEEGDDVAGVHLGEVKASETGIPHYAGPPPRRPPPPSAADTVSDSAVGSTGSARGARRRDVTLFLGPPPPMPPTSGGLAECLVLIGGLPWWLSDVELRRYAENFGQVRAIRILDIPQSGKSAGVALIEYARFEGALKAASPSQGLSSLPAWQSAKLSPPRAVRVSKELFDKMRAGTLPWPDGGPCRDDLRTTLMRQFDPSYVAPVSRPSESRQPLPRPSPSPEPEPRREEGWAEKLRALKANVNNNRGDGSLVDPRKRLRR